MNTNNKVDANLVPQKTLYTGEKIPCIGMGTFGSDRFTADEVSAAVDGAIKAGYRLFDCAAVYQNEDLIGKSFHRAIAEGTVRREELVITSKVWNNMHGKGDVLLSLAKTLKDLQLDYVDIFFVHWPFRNYHSPGCSGDSRNPDSKPFNVDEFIETWRQMERLVDMGLAKSIGMSNVTIKKLKAILPLCKIKPVAIEMELHPCFTQQKLYEYCVSNHIQPIGFCPIGSPTRPDRDRSSDDVVDIEEQVIVDIAKAHHVHPAIICLKWAVQRGQIPIPFSVRENEYLSNLRCTIEDPLTSEEMQGIEGIGKNCRLIKGQVFLWEEAKSWEDLWDLDDDVV